MYFLGSQLQSRNPFVRKFQDEEALRALWVDRNPVPTSAEALGKRVLKDYWEGMDFGLYSRKMFHRQKIEERFLEVSSLADHKELKLRFQKNILGKVNKINGDAIDWEEEEIDDGEGNDQYSEGVEESEYDAENSDYENNYDDKHYESP
jgi:hypothetical protein